MKNQIIKKEYYKITFKLVSPLSIGNGDNRYADKDVVRDGNGNPYIPGSSLAGVYRSLYNENAAKKYFGQIGKLDKDNRIVGKQEDSRIIVYDGVILPKDLSLVRVSIRDGVGLDEYKTAIDGAKYDFEILEPGITFETYIETNVMDGDVEATDVIAKAWKDNTVSFGGKNSRGLGRVETMSVQKISFDMKKEIDTWLDFDLYDAKAWENIPEWNDTIEESLYELMVKDDSIHFSIELEQKSPLTIRVYTTDVRTGDESQPDYKQLTQGKDGEAVIPGTSWAGLFRHNLLRLGMTKEELKEFYGVIDKISKKSHKSDIRFHESVIKDGKNKIVSRNAIDRFSGGTADTALFTEQMVYGGTTVLSIDIRNISQKDSQLMDKFLRLLAATMTDLHMGYIALGGETSIGHGLFSIKRIHWGDVTDSVEEWNANQLYECIYNQLKQQNNDCRKGM